MSDRGDTAGKAVFARHDALEREAAELLGRILFAYSRLDVLLGLCIAWAAGGQGVEAISRQVSRWDLNKRLGRLSRDVAASLVLDTAARAAYTKWIEEVHAVREERNQMVHGRWGVDTLRHGVVNVVGLPSSPDQQERLYALDDLKAFLGTIERLQKELSVLRQRHPLCG